VTGAEAHRPSKELGKRAKGLTVVGLDPPPGATPPKHAQPAPVRYHTDLGGGARPKEPAARYKGTEQFDPQRRGHTATSERQTYKDTHASQERRRLFDDDTDIEQHGFMGQFMEAAGAASQPELDGLIAVMDKEQLVASLQHMALQWKTLQGDATAAESPGRHKSDHRMRQPTIDIHTPDVTTLTPRARGYIARECADNPLPPEAVGTLVPILEPATPAVVPLPPTTGAEIGVPKVSDELRRKPAAKLERYGGQGASVESFIVQFETHAKYFQWKEEDRVFQLKNSLTGTAAQVLWTGGENATSAELIQLLHSRHGGKRQTERFWAELRARRRRKDEPLQELCQDIRRLMYLASPHETRPLAEHLSIDLYVAALGDPNMRMFVMSKDPVMLEDAYGYSTRYEALLLGATEQTQPAVLDPASYVYDDKGRKKENIRAVEIHPDTTQRDLEKKLAEQQQQLDVWKVWGDEFTRA